MNKTKAESGSKISDSNKVKPNPASSLKTEKINAVAKSGTVSNSSKTGKIPLGNASKPVESTKAVTQTKKPTSVEGEKPKEKQNKEEKKQELELGSFLEESKTKFLIMIQQKKYNEAEVLAQEIIIKDPKNKVMHEFKEFLKMSKETLMQNSDSEGDYEEDDDENEEGDGDGEEGDESDEDEDEDEEDDGDDNDVIKEEENEEDVGEEKK